MGGDGYRCTHHHQTYRQPTRCDVFHDKPAASDVLITEDLHAAVDLRYTKILLWGGCIVYSI